MHRIIPYLDTEFNMSEDSFKILVLKACIQGIGDQSKCNDFLMGADCTSIQGVNAVDGKEKLLFFFFLIKDVQEVVLERKTLIKPHFLLLT